MMGNPFQRVDPNKNYALAGRMVNALVDNLNTPQGAAQEGKSSARRAMPDCWVRNTTGSAQTTGTVMGIKCHTSEAADNGGTSSDPGFWGYQEHMFDVAKYDPATHGDRLVVLSEPAPDSDKLLTRAYTAGTVKMLINIQSSDHRYAQIPSGGDGSKLESAASGLFRIVSQPSGATGEQWCTVMFPVTPRNISEDDAGEEYTYEIDRTDSGDDDKEWNPANEKPSDWADYNCVKYTFELLRYDSDAGTLKRVKQEFHWAAMNAPVISAATVESASTGTCDD